MYNPKEQVASLIYPISALYLYYGIYNVIKIAVFILWNVKGFEEPKEVP